MQPLVSVIVPVYNNEKYLTDCIDSIINQTYSNLQVILVDDGSTDNSPAICDKYASGDSRIVVIHKKNQGAGKARNDGLKKATGELISFIDSDDIIAEKFYETMVSCFEADIDIVECEYLGFRAESDVSFKLIEPSKKVSYTMREAMKLHINEEQFKQVIWNKVYRSSIAKNIPFPEGKKIDDEYWTYQVIAKSNSLIHINSVMYAYRDQDQSVMHNLNTNGREQAIESKVLRLKYIRKHIPELYDEALYSVYMICLYQCQYVKRNDPGNYHRLIEFSETQISDTKSHKLKSPNLRIMDKVWVFIMKRSLNLACLIRNTLKIGI